VTNFSFELKYLH